MISIHLPRLASAATLLIALATADGQAQPARKLDVPFVPTPQEAVDRMLEMADVGPDDFLIDLGSGDGRIVNTAAQRFGTRGMGVDIDPERIQESIENASMAGVSSLVEFRNQDLFKTDISKATVLTMYLLPDINIRLRTRVLDELRPGTRVVSHVFTMGDWKPDAVTKAPRGGNEAYLWIVPAKVAGSWDARFDLPGGERAYQLTLTQHYQEVSGFARPQADGGQGLSGAAQGQTRRLPLGDMRLRGDQLEFTLTDSTNGQPLRARALGRADGDLISGVIRTEGSDGTREMRWRATRLSR